MAFNEATIIYNSRDEQFKRPVGAVRSGTDVSIDFLVSKNLDAKAMTMVLINDRDNSVSYHEMAPSETAAETDAYNMWHLDFTTGDRGLYWYYFSIAAPEGELKVGRSENNKAVITDEPRSWQQTVYNRQYDVPEWIRGGVFYHIFVDRFYGIGNRLVEPYKITRTDWGGEPEYRANAEGKILNNDFFGGNLAGIKEKLPYLEDLGVTCLYLSPIFEAFSNHKYDTGNYMNIDPMFGTEDDFTSLCEEAGKRGIRVICDGVFSHTGDDSVYFDKYGNYGGEGAWHNPDSKYRGWYYFHEGEAYDTWWGIDTLPRVKKDDPSYLEYINGENGVVRHWLKAGASGWRLDVADELPNSFLKKLAEAAKSEKSDSLIIGEVWEDASNKVSYDQRKNYFEGNKLDSVMNYPFKNAVIDFVRKGNAEGAAETVESILENYPDDVVNCLMNLLGNHDTPRILTALAGDDLPQDASREEKASHRLSDIQKTAGIKMLKIASVIQMTLPGVPCVYYGDEAGTEGYSDPFNRTCYPWGNENKELIAWYKKIIAIRKEHEVYRKGRYRTVAAINGTYAFSRFDENGTCATMMTAANCGSDEVTLIVSGTWKDTLTGIVLSNNFTIVPGEILLLEKIRDINGGI